MGGGEEILTAEEGNLAGGHGHSLSAIEQEETRVYLPHQFSA